MPSRSIGIRVTADNVFFAVIEKSDEEIEVKISDRIKLPKAYNFPQQLRHIRTVLIDIIRQHSVKFAGIRCIEPTSQNKSHARLNIEGVILETIASHTSSYLTGAIASIAPRLKMKVADYKQYISNNLNYDAVENWKQLKNEEKDAILVGIAAFED